MSNKLTKVLLLYDTIYPSIRLCAYEQLKYLSNSGKIEFNHCNFRDVTDEICMDSDVIVLVREASIFALQLALKLKRKGKYLLYILDDDLLNINEGLLSTQYYQNTQVKKRIMRMIKNCNVFLSPSIRILNKYQDICNKTSFIEEPCLIKINNKRSINEKIKIGFAGSIDRSSDINKILNNTILRIYEKYSDNIEIEFMGAKPDIVDKINLKYYPYLDDYEEYQKKLHELNWDIGLAPLPDTEFHKCKHYNKFIEYASVGIVGIYSCIEPYTRIIDNNVNGYLCNNQEDDWYNTIERLINNRYELDFIRANIYKEIDNKFTLEKVTSTLIQSVPEIVSFKSRKTKIKFVNFLKFKCFVIKCFEFILKNGIKSPLIIMRKIR